MPTSGVSPSRASGGAATRNRRCVAAPSATVEALDVHQPAVMRAAELLAETAPVRWRYGFACPHGADGRLLALSVTDEVAVRMPGWVADDGKANREAEVRLLTSFETSTDLLGASGECGCGQQEAEEQRQEEKERRIDHYPLGQEIARDREQGPIANACGGRAAQVVPAGAQPLQRTVDRDILARLTPQAFSP